MNLSRRLALALATLLAAAGAHAQGAPGRDNQTTVTVGARIAAKCRISSAAENINLVIDPAASGPVRAQTEVAFHCTKGTPFEIYVNNAQPGGSAVGLMLKPKAPQGAGGASAIGYSLSTRSSGNTGRGFGAPGLLEVVLTASVSPDQYADAAAGEYEDTVLVEIRP